MAAFASANETDASAIEKMIKENENIIVHVHATWCPSCKVQKELLESIENPNFEIVVVDFDSQKSFLEKHKVFKQSMLISYKNGTEIKRVFGITKKDKIMNFIDTSFTSSLQDTLNEQQSSTAGKKPEKVKLTMQQATQQLKDSGIIDNALKKGDKFVDFELPNINGQKVTLSKKLEDGPVVLTFYRGGWCPYCNLQLKAYQENLDAFTKAGGQLIAISPESMESANSTVEKNEIKFEILSDEFNKIAEKYGLVFKVNDQLKDVYLQFGPVF